MKRTGMKTHMERVSGIKFAKPDSPIYSHSLIVGSRHLTNSPQSTASKSQKKKQLKKMADQVGREAIEALENPR